MLTTLASGLSEGGREISVIASRQLYDAPDAALPARETLGGISIHRVWTTRFGRRNLLGRAVDYLTFYLSAAIAAWRRLSPRDIVVVMTDPPMLSIVIAPIALWRGATMVNWIQDLFPEVAEAVGLDRRRAPAFVYEALRHLRNRSLRVAAMNVVLGEKMLEKLAATGVAPDCSCVIPNWSDTRLVAPVAPNDNAFRREWGLSGKFVVGYSGNLGRAHDFHTILDAVVELEHETGSSDIVWLFIGGGALRDALAQELEARNLKTVLLKPYQPERLLAKSLSAADLHLVSLQPALEGLIVPSKFYGIAAAGRPTVFIGDADGEIARALRQNGIGVTTPQGDGKALAALVRNLSHQPERCRAMGAAARETAERMFDSRIAIARWEEMLDRLAERRPLP